MNFLATLTFFTFLEFFVWALRSSLFNSCLVSQSGLIIGFESSISRLSLLSLSSLGFSLFTVFVICISCFSSAYSYLSTGSAIEDNVTMSLAEPLMVSWIQYVPASDSSRLLLSVVVFRVTSGKWTSSNLLSSISVSSSSSVTCQLFVVKDAWELLFKLNTIFCPRWNLLRFITFWISEKLEDIVYSQIWYIIKHQ